MGNGIIAFLVAVGASTWIYSKFNRSTGGNIKSTTIATVISGICIFLLALLVLSFIPSK